MRRLASQPRNVWYGIPRRMRAQRQTQMTVHVRKLNRGMNNQQSINQSKQNNKSLGSQGILVLLNVVHYNNNKSRSPGAEFQKEFKKSKFKSKLNLN